MDPIVHDLNEGWRRALRLQRFVYELKDVAWRSQSAPLSWRGEALDIPKAGTVATVAMTEGQLVAYRKVMKMIEEFDPSRES